MDIWFSSPLLAQGSPNPWNFLSGKSNNSDVEAKTPMFWPHDVKS